MFVDVICAIVLVIGIIAVSVGLSFGISGIVNLCIKITENKRRKAHPKMWKWMKECNEKGKESSRWYNAMVKPLKDKIDTILREWDYYSTETKSQKEEELENLRKAMENAMEVYNEMCADTQALREAIHEYVEEHDLEWARHWGW